MAAIGSTTEATFSDGATVVLNVDTLNKIVSLQNGSALKAYSDAGTTLLWQLTAAGLLGLPQSATAVAIANAGTVATAGLGVSRINPAANVTGLIMAAGTIPGQLIIVVNESAFSAVFDVSGTSNVADGVGDIINPKGAKLYVWDSGTSLWYGLSLTNGALSSVQSATAAAIANAGTITTQGVGVARLNPASAVTGIIMQVGLFPGQLCLVVNEAAVANSIAFNTTPGTSNVADSATEAIIPGLQSRLFVWDSVQSLWFPVGNPLANGTYVSVQSATAPDPGGNGTITTSGVGVARVSPAAARSGIILQAGTYPGQEVTVVNEATAANTLTFNTTPATSNVADSATEGNIPGLTARSFVWDSSTSLWYRQN